MDQECTCDECIFPHIPKAPFQTPDRVGHGELDGVQLKWILMNGETRIENYKQADKELIGKLYTKNEYTLNKEYTKNEYTLNKEYTKK
jgi:hypothetical protein